MSSEVAAADAASKNIVEAIKATKEAPPETSESRWTRRLVLLSFWAVAVFFGLPVWWKTTTVYRAPLPLGEMLDWADGKVFRQFFVWAQERNADYGGRSVDLRFRYGLRLRRLLCRRRMRNTSCALRSMRSMT